MMQTLARPLPHPAADAPPRTSDALPRTPDALPRDAGQVVLVVRDLVVTTLIGIYDYEHVKPQRLRLNLELALNSGCDRPWTHADLVATAGRIVTEGHTNLLECLAERLASALLSDGRAAMALIRLEKLDAFAECEAVGVEIVRAG